MINVDLRSRVPFYEQLVSNIKEEILIGNLKPDDKIPSVRELAVELTINPNTIQKAYRILEQEGYIYTVRGKGNFVMKLENSVINEEKNKIFTELNNLLEDAYKLSVSENEIIDSIAVFYKRKEEM